MADRRLFDMAHRHALAGHDHRHADGMLVHIVLAPEAVIAVGLAMVAGVDDARVLGHTAVFQRLKHQPDIVVEERAEAVIGRDRAPHDIFRKRLFRSLEQTVAPERRMVGPITLFQQIGQRHILRRV